jgi:glycosyltransferase involved in cell wall biosynthesis
MYSIIIPVYNEKDCIVDTIKRINKTMKGFTHEIICVNDCSKDGSDVILDTFAKEYGGIKVIHNTSNKGYGASLKRGFKVAKGDYFIITDADGTYPVEEIPNLLEHLPQYDMVVGNRIPEPGSIPFKKKVAKGILKQFGYFITGVKIPDLNSGLRVFRKELAEKFFHLFPDGFSLTSTITISSLLSGYDVKYVDIPYYKRVGRSSIKFTDFFKFMFLISRLAVYFKPLSFFFYPGLFMFFCGCLLGSYQIIKGDLGDLPMLLFMLGGMSSMFGFLADMILRQHDRIDK